MTTPQKKQVGVVLSGCGYLDGAEIHEATLTLLALDMKGAHTQAFAPNKTQSDTINHLTQSPSDTPRSVLEEASRICRGEIRALEQAHASELDALIFPGGFGAAKNLCTFATDGPQMLMDPQVMDLIRAMHDAKKPMGFICIAPVLAAKTLGELRPKLTIGHDTSTAQAIEKMGATHVPCDVDNIVVDPTHTIASTPAYMLGPSIAPVWQGIEKLVSWVVEQ